MENELNTKKNGNQAMLKICGFIVDKRNLFFLLFGLLIIFSAISRNWVQVENSMAHYLPGTTETKQGLDLMVEEFITYGTCNVMIANVSYEQAEHIYDRLEQAAGVFSVDLMIRKNIIQTARLITILLLIMMRMTMHVLRH